MKDFELLNFLHLADSAWPVGSFAFSLGLEAMSKHGQLNCLQDLADHFDASLEQNMSFEVPILHSLYKENEFEEAIHYYHLCNRTPSIREAAIMQGRAWLRLIPVTHPQVNTEEIESYFEKGKSKPYYIAVFSKFMKSLGYDIKNAIHLFLYSNLRDQVTASIRLGLVGPSQGHAILSKRLSYLNDANASFNTGHFSDAVRTLPVADVAQLAHANLYSKLFRN